MPRLIAVLKHLRRNVVGYLALFVVLSTGTAYAANSVFSADIVDGEVRSVDVADNNLTGTDVRADGLTGLDIDERTLSVANLGCQPGKVLGSARIKGSSAIPTTYTASAVHLDTVNNCTGGSVNMRRASAGVYFVRFSGNPATLAVATPNEENPSSALSGDTDNLVSVGKVTAGADAGAFRVDVQDIDPAAPGGHRAQDGRVTLVLP